MREIKFRQPLLHYDGKFHRFYYWGYLDDCFTGPCLSGWKKGLDQEYTGLKDKNGVEIYEGDLLKYPNHKGFYEIKFLIDFDDTKGGDCGFVCERDKPSYNYMLPCVWNTMEVIGNIYENKELLE